MSKKNIEQENETEKVSNKPARRLRLNLPPSPPKIPKRITAGRPARLC